MDGNSDINLQGQNLERVNTFKYLGATLAENGDLATEMTHRIQSGWKNWKRESGVLCDRRISLRVKGKLYKKIVRSEMRYGAETWAVKKAHEKKLDVMEMRMLTHGFNIMPKTFCLSIDQSIILFADTNVSQWAHAIQRSIDYVINNPTLNTEIA